MDETYDLEKTVKKIEEALPDYVKQPGTFTYEDYEALPEEVRCELIDGYLYDMTAPNIDHQSVAGEVHYQILDFIKKRNGRCKVFIAPTDVRLDGERDTMVQPDVFIVCDEKKLTKKHVIGAPDFILEVLSKSTRTKDLYVKTGKYKSVGVREYWMIDLEKKTLIRYLFEKSDAPRISSLEGVMEVAIYDGELKIDLGEIKEFVKRD
ncbi:MAG: Uma2 family endonuclease [Eubacterium sp.]|nr:Uma2 family endonuclease [Eubacterium sp.]